MSLDYGKLESRAPTRTRTADLLITNQLLYQLSYRGNGVSFALSNSKRQAFSGNIFRIFAIHASQKISALKRGPEQVILPLWLPML